MDWLLSEMSASWLFWAVAVLLALVGTAGAVWFGRRGLRATETADGTVVELEESLDSDGATLYRAIVVFAVDGVEHRIADPVAQSPAAFRTGQQVRVSYPPGRPDLAQLGRWRYAGPFVAMGLVGWGCLAAMLAWRLT